MTFLPSSSASSARRNVAGSKKVGSEVVGLVGVPRVLELFVGGCGTDTTMDHLTKYCSDNGVIAKKCEELTTQSPWYKPFKLSVLSSDKIKVMNSDFWPEGVFVRQFFV